MRVEEITHGTFNEKLFGLLNLTFYINVFSISKFNPIYSIKYFIYKANVYNIYSIDF